MDYWASARWKLAITGQDDEQWLEPPLPFLLIGSHPCCVGRIEEPRVPSVVYLACCFAESIEVWPLCAVAFPRWGVNLPEHTLSVGRKRISLFHESDRRWPKIAERGTATQPQVAGIGGGRGVRRKITLDWDGTPRSKVLARRVTIMGGEHPSTLRLYGQELKPCDHAVICVGTSVWLIDLNPPAEETDVRRLCKRLRSTSDCEIVGKIKVRLGRAIGSKRRSDASASKNGIDLLEGGREEGDPILPGGVLTTVTDGTDLALGEMGTTESAGPDTLEVLTSKLTDRLVRIDQAKFNRQRLIRLSVYLAAFLVALIIVLWIIFAVLVPMIPATEP